MALNRIWVAFFLIAFVVAGVKLAFFHDTDVFANIVQSTFDMAKVSVTLCIGLIGAMAMWLGIMKIGEEGGSVRILSKLVGPFFHRLFPELPKDHPAHGSMLMNISANMLGLDNAATPLGLKAMEQLQEANPNKSTASNAMIMFLVLNTSGLTVIPVSVMALLASEGSASPSDVFLPILLATSVATLVGLIAVSVMQRINLFQPVVLAYLGGAITLIGGAAWYLSSLPKAEVEVISKVGGNFILFGLITAFIALGVWRKVNIYDAFVTGAKDGFNVAIKIIPYLVAMLVAIGVFRASGALDMIMDGIRFVAEFISPRTEWVDAFPTALMKPLSGSGARGMFAETMTHHGVDSLQAKIAACFQGSTETTFYTLAVYYGAVAVKNTRYTLGCGLIADAAGIVAAIFFAYLFFG